MAVDLQRAFHPLLCLGQNDGGEPTRFQPPSPSHAAGPPGTVSDSAALVRQVYPYGADFSSPALFEPKDWPDCKAGKQEQRFTYWVDVEPSQCLFDCGDEEECGTPCQELRTKTEPCPRPCSGTWSPCDPSLGHAQQLTYTIETPAEEGGVPCEFEDGSVHMVTSCPSDCVGKCQCDPQTQEFKLFELSPALHGGEECPEDERARTHAHCTDCQGEWDPPVCNPDQQCEDGETYQLQT